MFKWIKRKFKGGSSSHYTNEEWLQLLDEPADQQALDHLRNLLVRGLYAFLVGKVDQQPDQLAEDFAQDAILKILDHLHTFRGESKFTTWAMKIAVREALTELRRKRWDDISINDLKPDDNERFVPPQMADNKADPEQVTSDRMLLEKVQHIVDEVLTEKQRTAIRLVMYEDLPIDVVAEKMGSNRNSMYKLIYDARKKIKGEFEKQGLDPEELLTKL